MLTLYTFGDSILNCAHYNESDVDPGTLLLRNDDRLFPEFRGRDLASLGPCRLEHRARDGSTVEDLLGQMDGLKVKGPAIALLTVGGNDILRGLSSAGGPDLADFALALEDALRALPIRPVLIGNVYDPSFGDDANNFLGSRADPGFARECLRRVNRTLAEAAVRHGGSLVDLHGHFLEGDPSWLTLVIEPSLAGASEVRRCFLPYELKAASAPAPGPASPEPPNAPGAAPPLGLDLDGTLDEHRAFFRTLSHLWPGKVYVITYRDSRVQAEADLASLGIRFDEVVLVDAFEQKAQEIARLGITVYFDDQDEVLRHVPEGVSVFKVRNGGNFDFEDARWLYSRKTGRSLD